MKKYIITGVAMLIFATGTFAQKVDSLRLLKDVNGGDVVFTPVTVAANVTWGNGYGTNNMAFIAALRAYTTSILPITLSSFKPNREANAVKLAWSTSSEHNSDYFDVLKSTDGKNFFSIGVVSAAGNSAQNLNYSFKDVNPVKGTNYYQLNMVDLDGTAKKTIIVSSNFDIDKSDFNVVTDAEKGTVSLAIYSNKAKKGIFDIYDLLGNKLATENVSLQSGSNTFELRLDTSAKIIIIQFTSEGDKQVKKMFY